MTALADPGGGQRVVQGTGPCPPSVRHTCFECETAWIPTEWDLEQGQFLPCRFGSRSILPGVEFQQPWHCPPVEPADNTTATSHLADLHPAFDYKCFNSSNVSIHSWSWNYRSCWHQTCPPVDTHHCVWIASITSLTGHKGQARLLQFVAASPLPWHWAICAPAAHLGSGSRLSGSLSGIEP